MNTASGVTAGPRPADGALQPDKPQLREFFERTLRYVPDGSFYSFRSFHHDPKLPPWRITGVKLHLADEGYDELVRLAAREAFYAANHDKPIVLAPPSASFNNKKRATEANLACAPTLTIECDARPAWSCRQMQGLLGSATAIVSSGGSWTDPDTGEVEDKLHVYWRLREPALEAAGFAKVKRARRLMAALVGSDTTAVPVVHPLRLPGSWHTKDKAHLRLCLISGGDADAEADLGEVLEALEDAAALAGIDRDTKTHASNPSALADSDDDLLALADAIPNAPPADDASAEEKARDRSTRRERWNRIGMAFWAASGGSDAGLAAFIAWSMKRSDCSGKPDAAMARWAHYRTSPPGKLTVGTLIYEARKAFEQQGKVFRLPSWQRTQRQAAPDEMFPHADDNDAEGTGAAGASACSDDATFDWNARLTLGIAELNGRYFVVTVGGRAVVAWLIEDAETGRERLVFSREADIRLLYAHRHYLVGYSASGKEIWKGLGDAWLTDSRRRTYRRFDLITGGNCPTDVYNLWRGFGVVPAAGPWPKLRAHLLEVICDGDTASCAWLVAWIARAVQNPSEHAETAIVLRGSKGTGKGMVGQIMIRLFSSHSLHVTHSKHLVGHFNQHLVDALFLFADEAFWAGDKAGEGALKALITERMFHIEPKGIDSFQARNRLKILISSNEDWVVPVTSDERRFFVLEVSNRRKGDRNYFKQLAHAIEGAELQAMLHDLLAMDLSGFDHRNPPHTAGLNRQKLVGADSLVKYWNDCLLHGELIGTGESEWPGDVVAQVFHAAYVDYARGHGDHYPLSDAKMAEKLVELLPDKVLRRIRLNKAHGDAPRPTRYVLPPLDEARTAFLGAMNIDLAGHPWPVVEGAADA